MAASLKNLFFALCFVMPLVVLQTLVNAQDEGGHSFLDIETPQTFTYNSPLRQPDSLRSRPYFDFLSTLYRHDATKSNLFTPYQRTRRDAAPLPIAAAVQAPAATVNADDRLKRAIVFRPLFVYKQQEIRKQELAAKRRRRL